MGGLRGGDPRVQLRSAPRPHQPPGLLPPLLLPPQASIASYSMGPYGGLRAAALARPFLSELGLVPLPSTLCIPTVQNSGLAEDGLQVDNERIVRTQRSSARK